MQEKEPSSTKKRKRRRRDPAQAEGEEGGGGGRRRRATQQRKAPKKSGPTQEELDAMTPQERTLSPPLVTWFILIVYILQGIDSRLTPRLTLLSRSSAQTAQRNAKRTRKMCWTSLRMRRFRVCAR